MKLLRKLSLMTFLLGLVIAVPDIAPADALSLAGRAPILQGRVAMVSISAPQDSAPPPVTVASLFVGDEGKSFFAPYPVRLRSQPKGGSLIEDLRFIRSAPNSALTGGGPADRVRHLIAAAEAGRHGYDAVQYGATRKPAGRPTDMTIEQIYAWIKATPGQPHAIGRYQFIPATLRRLVDITKIDHSARFSAEVQDALADVLLDEAGFREVQAGHIGRHTFMNNLAKIWAGLPNSTGQSHYHGYAGNKATMTWARFDAEMAMIFPG
jgi:muramidase (phage lysozyme)